MFLVLHMVIKNSTDGENREIIGTSDEEEVEISDGKIV